MRNKKRTSALTIAGGVLIVAAVLAFAAITFGKTRKEGNIQKLISRIEAVMPERTAAAAEERSDTRMPAIDTDGDDFIGILEIPGCGIRLPVAAGWSKNPWAFRPARYEGSAYDGTLIIGGSGENGNFGFADGVDVGETVIFTDITGKVFTYKIERINHADNANAEILRSDASLTLFVNKNGGYIIIRCK